MLGGGSCRWHLRTCPTNRTRQLARAGSLGAGELLTLSARSELCELWGRCGVSSMASVCWQSCQCVAECKQCVGGAATVAIDAAWGSECDRRPRTVGVEERREDD